MTSDIRIPQGKYRVGRDIPEGIYLIAALNDYSHIKIEKENPKVVDEYYHLDDDNGKMCHVEIVNGDTMFVDGNVKVRHITRFMSESSTDFSLLEEIEDFQNSLKGTKSVKKNTNVVEGFEEEIGEDEEEEALDDSDDEEYCEEDVETEDFSEPKPKKKVGFWSALGTLLSSTPSERTSSSGNTWSSQKKKHSGRCDGDCANCPPHYGYRYGRWYYGHSHSEGCVFGGNKCNGGRD